MKRAFWALIFVGVLTGAVVTGNMLMVSGPQSGAVLTAAGQSALDSEQVLKKLQEGNARFLSGKTLRRDSATSVGQTAHEQHPMATILSCMDARVGPACLTSTSGTSSLCVLLAMSWMRMCLAASSMHLPRLALSWLS